MNHSSPTLLSVAALIGTMAVSGCQLLGFNPYDNGIDHERVWRANSDGTYTFIVDRYCFCYLAGRFEVEVEDYEIQYATDVQTGEALDSTDFQYISTIEGLFDLVREARRSGAEKVRVEYADLGYPAVVDIDWRFHAADDELYYAVISVNLPD